MGLGSGGKSSDGGPEAAAPPRRPSELKDGWKPGLGAQEGPWSVWEDAFRCLAQTAAGIFVSQ